MKKEEMDQNAADYADQFNQADTPPREVSDDEAFGLGPESAAAEASAPPEGSPAEEAAESPAAEAAEEPGGEGTPAEQAAEAAAPEPDAMAAEAAAPSPADQEQRLKSWEGRLKARQAELDAREAAMGDSSVNDEQESLPLDDAGSGAEASAEHGDNADPAQVLAEDFGADFVDQLTKLVTKIAESCMDGVSYKVDCVIKDLTNERLQNHFNAIAATHGDFMEVVESPEFGAWKASQPDQAALQEVIDRGSSRQIIGMLTAFKEAHRKDDGGGPGYEDDALDAAEGVRSSGVTLPKEPTDSEDYTKAWNEA
jgi:hypothetical protein